MTGAWQWAYCTVDTVDMWRKGAKEAWQLDGTWLGPRIPSLLLFAPFGPPMWGCICLLQYQTPLDLGYT